MDKRTLSVSRADANSGKEHSLLHRIDENIYASTD